MGYQHYISRICHSAAGLLLALPACVQDPQVVASNCNDDKSCIVSKAPLKGIDAVDVLVIVDNSGSIRDEVAELKAQLPRMLNAIVTGSDQDTSFPPASSVHVAVVDTDMGAGEVDDIKGCMGLGHDGLFVLPDESNLSCKVSHPSYLAYDGGPAALATVDSVSCLPLGMILPDSAEGPGGCGFEMPLEAGLKALWPASDASVTFLDGKGHGEDENAGFLRKDSLLVVIVVTDEDDCSAEDPSIFTPADYLPEGDPLLSIDLNLRCSLTEGSLHPTSRYIEKLRALRPNNDNIVFATIAGIPPELVSEDALAAYDLSMPADVDAYFDGVLADPRMQNVVDPNRPPEQGGNLIPSCDTAEGTAYPPRRLVEVAKGFGSQGVLGSLCDADFGATTGRLIRAIGTRLAEAAEAPVTQE